MTQQERFKQQFIERSIAKFGDVFDYSKVKWTSRNEKVKFFCKSCKKSFLQSPKKHLEAKNPCPNCRERAKRKLATKAKREAFRNKVDDIVQKLRSVHGDKYDYSLIKRRPIEDNDKIQIICPKHGEFTQPYRNHLAGRGCRACFHDGATYNRRMGNEEFIRRAKYIHGEIYDYSLVEYKNNSTKVTLICKEHGQFQIQPANHLCLKSGCRKCHNQHGATKQRQPITIERFREIRGDQFDYSKTVFKQYDDRITVTCRVHGDFVTTKYHHIKGIDRCPKCPKVNPWD